MTFLWLKRYVPKSLFGRTLLILLVPIITIQLAVSYVFIQRLYQNVTTQMTRSLLLDLRYISDQIAESPTQEDALAGAGGMADALGIDLGFLGDDGFLPARGIFDLSGAAVDAALRDGLQGYIGADLQSQMRRVLIAQDTPLGPVGYSFARDRVSASNPHQLLVLMVVVSVLMTLVSFLFLKNQVRPIRQLAEAAKAFGKGETQEYWPRGATEVRQAGANFLAMRNRIERHIEQRTLLLSGVSHDLRTPLTRMRLAVSFMDDTEERRALEQDITEMEGMLDTFLTFARLDATEEREPIDPVALARSLVELCQRTGDDVTLGAVDGEGTVSVSPMSLERALQNLIGNGLRYGTKVRMGVWVGKDSVRFRVEDDGPGIPASRREEAMKPFSRLDASRNQNEGSGVGLGLSIVGDIAHQHGGSLRLGDSEEMGGLMADLIVAR